MLHPEESLSFAGSLWHPRLNIPLIYQLLFYFPEILQLSGFLHRQFFLPALFQVSGMLPVFPEQIFLPALFQTPETPAIWFFLPISEILPVFPEQIFPPALFQMPEILPVSAVHSVRKKEDDCFFRQAARHLPAEPLFFFGLLFPHS